MLPNNYHHRQERLVSANTLQKYIPEHDPMLPTLTSSHDNQEASFASEREILYKILFDMKKDMNDLKRLVYNLMQNESTPEEKPEPTTSIVSGIFMKKVLLKSLLFIPPHSPL